MPVKQIQAKSEQIFEPSYTIQNSKCKEVALTILYGIAAAGVVALSFFTFGILPLVLLAAATVISGIAAGKLFYSIAKESKKDPLETCAEQLLNNQNVILEETNNFSQKQLIHLINDKPTGRGEASGHLTNFGKTQNYPHMLIDPTDSNAYTNVNKNRPGGHGLLKEFVAKTLTLNNDEPVLAKLQNSLNNHEKRKALHLSALLALVGDYFSILPTNSTISSVFTGQDKALDLNFSGSNISLHTSSFSHLGTKPITFTAQEHSSLKTYIFADYVTAKQNTSLPDKVLSNYKVNRTVTIQPPDDEGNVLYSVRREFISIPVKNHDL